MTSNQYDLVESPGDAISSIRFSTTSSKLLVSSWDKHVYLYDVSLPPAQQFINKYEFRAPILDVCFGSDDNEAYTAGVDWDVTRLNLETGETSVLSSHENGVKSVVYSSSNNLVISASWDRTLRVHFLSNPGPPNIIPLTEKPFAISINSDKVVVAMANRHIYIYDMKSLMNNSGQVEPWQRREASMKFQTRCVSCMPSGLGFATSSIEGRVSVEWFDPSPEVQAKKYAFKCHRELSAGYDVIYPVNALAFHPVNITTFASGGGDGTVVLWDGATKRRIRQYQKFPASIAALGFSGDGKFLAVAYSSGFEDGKENLDGPVGITIKELGENETKGKPAKEK